MTDPTDPLPDAEMEALAGRLTKAQRTWLAGHKISDKWLTAHGLESTALMEGVGTASRWGGQTYAHYRLSNLGLRLRTYLLHRENGS